MKKSNFLKILILILVIVSCSNIRNSESELFNLISNSKINSYENCFTRDNYDKCNNSLSRDIIKKIIDSLDYSCVNKSTLTVLNTTHLKITDKCSFFDIVFSYNNTRWKEVSMDSIVGFYKNDKLFLIENLCDDMCSELKYSNLTLIDDTIKIQNIDSYSCNMEDFEYFKNVYTIKDGIMTYKSDTIDEPARPPTSKQK